MTTALLWFLLTLPLPLLAATYHRNNTAASRLAARADKQHAALKTNPMYAIHGDYPPKCCSTRVCACDHRRKLDADFWYADPDLWPGPKLRGDNALRAPQLTLTRDELHSLSDNNDEPPRLQHPNNALSYTTPASSTTLHLKATT